MKSLVLVLAVIRDPEPRSQVRAFPDEGGHRVIEVKDCPQAELLLTNRSQPDLVLVGLPRTDSTDSAQFSDVLHAHSRKDHATFVKLNRSAISFNISEGVLPNFTSARANRAPRKNFMSIEDPSALAESDADVPRLRKSHQSCGFG